MFEALRWRLTGWYVLAFALAFAIIGVVVFFWVERRLTHDVNQAVYNVSETSRQAVAREGDLAASDASVRRVLANASLGGSADVFVLLLTPDGMIADNPSDIPTDGLPVIDSLQRAADRDVDDQGATVQGRDLRIRTAAIRAPDGQLLGFVQAGKSLEERDESLRTLALVMAGGGLAGLALATAGGLFVAGVAIRPVQRSFLRQREFISDASHELRTPLAVIRANSEALATSRPGDEAAEDMAAETQYMTRLLDDLLTLAGSDRDGLHIEKNVFDLSETVRRAGQAGARLAGSAGLAFRLDANGSALVEGDEARCHEVLLALLDNAVKYSGNQGTVSMRVQRSGSMAAVEVTDNGIGIAPEHQSRIFDRFYRVDKARSRSIGGAGLGLSIAREIVDAHHGQLEVRSSPGSGSTFTLRLPLAPAS